MEQTSLIAYGKNMKEKKKNRKLVFSCVPCVNALSAWEITKKLNYVYALDFHRNNTQPRLNELVKAGLVLEDRKFCPVAKQMCKSYRRF